MPSKLTHIALLFYSCEFFDCVIVMRVQREVINLRQLCWEKGASEDQIAVCKPVRRRAYYYCQMSTNVIWGHKSTSEGVFLNFQLGRAQIMKIAFH